MNFGRPWNINRKRKHEIKSIIDRKSLSRRKVVKGISLEVSQGQIVGLLGPNGAGKTTSFYMIVGLIKPNAGTILLDDQESPNSPCTAEPNKALVIWHKRLLSFES